MKTLSPSRIRAARAVAICADLIQVGFPSLFGEGILSPFDAALDIVTCLALSLLVGWHIAFVPTFLIEILPIANLAPTWTIAAFIATRGSQALAAQMTTAVVVPQDNKGRPLAMVDACNQTAAPHTTAPTGMTGCQATNLSDGQNIGNES